MSANHNDKFIERSSSDNSALTKQVTYWGEVVDFTQFTCMTGLSDVLNAFLQKNGKEIPVFGLTGLDVFSYTLMVYLANLRTGKFAERNALLNDQNAADYYSRLAQALYDCMSSQDRVELASDNTAEMDDKSFIIELLKFNAQLLNPGNLPAARPTLNKWRDTFNRMKHSPAFVAIWYKDLFKDVLTHKLCTDENVREKLEEYSIDTKTLDQIELEYIRIILNRFSVKNISEKDAQCFYTKLKIIENIYDAKDILSKQLDLLALYGVPSVGKRHEARHYFEIFYDAYHAREDKNDKAFYKANMRGIQAEENYRTHFKKGFFHLVRDVSAVGLAYSVITFGTSVAFELLKKNPLPLPYLVAPLFIVGFTSLVDEASDLYFKNKKYWQSRDDLQKWEAVHGTSSTDPEYKELQDRLTRRGTKLAQASLSFMGVFFGVLISWAVSILAMAYNLPDTGKALSFAGFGTIGTAGVAGCVMVAYQHGQNNKKIAQAQVRETELFEGAKKVKQGYWTHYPRERKPEAEIHRLGLAI